MTVREAYMSGWVFEVSGDGVAEERIRLISPNRVVYRADFDMMEDDADQSVSSPEFIAALSELELLRVKAVTE